jgi:hypothetical protein
MLWAFDLHIVYTNLQVATCRGLLFSYSNCYGAYQYLDRISIIRKMARRYLGVKKVTLFYGMLRPLPSTISQFWGAKSGCSRVLCVKKSTGMICSHTQPNTVTRVSITGFVRRRIPTTVRPKKRGYKALTGLPATPPISSRVTSTKSLAIKREAHKLQVSDNSVLQCVALLFDFRRA